jgi:hypothetical protein
MTTSAILIPPDVAGEYLLCLSTDISTGKLVTGNTPIKIGLRVYTSDDQKWFIITAGDGTVTTFKQPALST